MAEKFDNYMVLFSDIFKSKNIWGLVGELTVILLVTVITSLFFYYLHGFLDKRFKKTAIPWDNIVLGSLKKPIQLLIWLVGIGTCIDAINIYYPFKLYNYVKPAEHLLIIFTFAWFGLRFISELENYWYRISHKGSSKMDKATADAIANLLRVIVLLFTVLTAAESAGVGISGVIALAGGSSLVIAFASKDIVANFFGAIMLYFDKPFIVGESIRVAEKNIEGNVEKIGLRCTVIRNWEKKPLYVPNSFFAIVSIENLSRITHKKIDERIFIRHEDISLAKLIVQEINSLFANNKELDPGLPGFNGVDKISQDGVAILITAYTKKTDIIEFQQLKQQLLVDIAAIIHKHGARVAAGNTVYLAHRLRNLNREESNTHG